MILKLKKNQKIFQKKKDQFFSKIFGLKNNVKNESKIDNSEQNISHTEIIISENMEKDTLQSLSNQSIEEIKPEFEMIDDYDNYDNKQESSK